MDIREKILSSNDLKREKVDVPEWGVTLYVRTMNGIERDEFEVRFVAKKGDKDVTRNMRAFLVASTSVDEAGKRIFNDDDVAQIGTKSCAVLDRIARVSMRINRLADEDVKELAGN